jgi:membrane protein implicated in regulation of membrane protease activity
MNRIRRALEALFVITLAASLLGGVVFVAGQALALAAGQGEWLGFFNTTVKTPMCIAASLCALAGYLLSYRTHQDRDRRQEASTR